ncbi:DAK2 domain-containing protein [Streptomyces sp. TG1A-8]|uniref:DAK2 domain-containing protein n=1 Tax=Streptomyces sp. TG1A-8 TaxID=3051385 RepID=UPI00265B7D7D|nr:DAK2 domain-containing protein [Streptomyces sp. TG1A-8]MDO0929048.1 DAK2 domain-containing protein [Streptomyces sp. TG1A-8]
MLDHYTPEDDTTHTGAAFTEGWMRRFAASARATEAQLTALDQQVGDGDFGTNLRAGLDATVTALDTEAVTVASTAGRAARAGGPLQTAATAFLDGVGGTSGPLFGLLLEELAVAAAGPALDLTALRAGLTGGLAAIQRVGEARPGDKTLVDALYPACEALRVCPAEAGGRTALAHASRAAWEGVRCTARLRARRGRASYVGTRATGVPDPGAVGIGLLLSSAGGVVAELAPLLAEPEPAGPS